MECNIQNGNINGNVVFNDVALPSEINEIFNANESGFISTVHNRQVADVNIPATGELLTQNNNITFGKVLSEAKKQTSEIQRVSKSNSIFGEVMEIPSKFTNSKNDAGAACQNDLHQIEDTTRNLSTLENGFLKFSNSLSTSEVFGTKSRIPTQNLVTNLTTTSEIVNSMTAKPMKKQCPLEMSIKAANLDEEFEKDYDLYDGNQSCTDEARLAADYESEKDDFRYHKIKKKKRSEVKPAAAGDPYLMMNPTTDVNSSTSLMLMMGVVPQAQALPVMIMGSETKTASEPVVIAIGPEPTAKPLVTTIQQPEYLVQLGEQPSMSHTTIVYDKSQKPTSSIEDNNQESMICEVDDSEEDSSGSSSDESHKDGAPETLVMKIRKVPLKQKNTVSKPSEPTVEKEIPKLVIPPSSWRDGIKKRDNTSERSEKLKVSKKSGSKRRRLSPSSDQDWSLSDDDCLATVVRKKNEDSEVFQNDNGFKKAPSNCCSKMCSKKNPVKDQLFAFKTFREMENKGEGDIYLSNCLRYKYKRKRLNSSKKKSERGSSDPDSPPSPWPNYEDKDINMEIANESNGNQSLSYEIQNAIEESLRDQETAIADGEKVKPLILTEKKSETVSKKLPKPVELKESEGWTYLLSSSSGMRKVCLKFLLAVLQVSEERIKKLQKRKLKGEKLVGSSTMSKPDACQVAQKHLDTLATKPVPTCKANPPHVQLVEPSSKQQLYGKYRQFYMDLSGQEPISIQSYLRFLNNKTTLEFSQSGSSCGRCGFKDSMGSAKEKKVKNKITMKKNRAQKKPPRGDVFSLMQAHLKIVPYVVPSTCAWAKHPSRCHHFFDPSKVTIQSLYEEYRKYFLKHTNSELGLRYTIYESLFKQNPYFSIENVDPSGVCPRCPKSSGDSPGDSKNAKKVVKKKMKASVNR